MDRTENENNVAGAPSALNAGLDDKQDAERFRWLLKHCTNFLRPVDGVLTNGRFRYKRGSCFSPREAIDKAMAANDAVEKPP